VRSLELHIKNWKRNKIDICQNTIEKEKPPANRRLFVIYCDKS